MLAPMRSRKPLLACLLGVAIAVPALAQSGASVTQYPACPDPPPKLSQVEIEAAHASYRVGVEAYNRGDYQKALDNFREAFRRDCSKVALLNFISRAYEGLGQKAEAIHALEVYLQRNPKAEDAEDIQTRIKNLKAQLASSSSTATTTATAPTATVTATVTATATPTATATAAPTETAEVRGHGAAPWVVVGVGAAAAIAGGVLIGVGQGDVSASRVKCTSNANGTLSCIPADTTPGGQNRATLNSRGTTETNVGLVVGGVGLAAIVGGLIWHFVEPTGPAKTALAPVVAPGYAGLSLAGKF